MQIISNGKKYAENNIDIKNKIVTFESGDDLNPTAPVDMPKITSGHSMKDFLKWGSLAVKNVRYLLKMFGTADISAIGNGTVTGAIDALNTGLGNQFNYEIHHRRINSGTATTIELKQSTMYLICIANPYKVGAVYIVQTGSPNSSGCKVSTFVSQSPYFAVTSAGNTAINITAGSADGYLSALPIDYYG